MKFLSILLFFVGVGIGVALAYPTIEKVKKMFKDHFVPACLLYVLLGIGIFALAGDFNNDLLMAIGKGFGLGFAGGSFTAIDEN